MVNWGITRLQEFMTIRGNIARYFQAQIVTYG